MNTEQVNIDAFVDYAAEYKSVIKNVKVMGDHIIGCCPFHDDKRSSFSADLTTGMCHCFAGCISGNFLTFWAKKYGTTTKDAYKQILDKYGRLDAPRKPDKKPEKKQKSQLQGLTLAEYAFAKRLPEEWLKEQCRLQTKRDRDGTQYVYIPYYEENGVEATFRKRYADKQFRWKYGAGRDICMYGAWKLESVRKLGYAALVEGESDSQSMWYMGISALGVPGASMMRAAWAMLLQDLKIYIHVEPDKGGEAFLAKVTGALKEGGFIGQVYKWSCRTLGCKDPSDVYMKYGKEDAADKLRKAIEHAEQIDIDKAVIPETVKDAPVNLRQPEGWTYSDEGITMIDEKQYAPIMVCRTPIIITQRLRSMETGEEKIEVAFKRDGHWNRAVYPRSTIFTAKGITLLADLGCTVTSENAKQVVRFLSALEAENIDVIKKSDATATFGWQGSKRFLPGHGGDLVLDIEPSMRGWAAAYCQSGTFDGWRRLVAPHRVRDKFRFILAASFAAPLLRILKQRIFFVYNWGGSKGGKTAALKAALSVWGDPDRLMVNFNATQVALERMAGFYNDLPMGIDERQLAGQNQESLEKIVYMLASGTGRARGSKNGGLQTMHTWRTVVLATGEEPLSTSTSQTGVSTRVLELYGGPFTSEKDASLMHQQTGLHHGHAGIEFIRRLLALEERDIIDNYEIMLEEVSRFAQGSSVAHVAGISAVALADALIEEWIFSDGAADDAADASGELVIHPATWQQSIKMAKSIMQEQMSAGVIDVNESATQYIVDWIMSNRLQFGEKVMGTCLGTINGDEGKAYIFPSIFNQVLEKAGYSPRKTLRYLAEQGLVTEKPKTNGGKQYSILKRFDGRVCRFIEFDLEKCSKSDEWAKIGDSEQVPFK